MSDRQPRDSHLSRSGRPKIRFDTRDQAKSYMRRHHGQAVRSEGMRVYRCPNVDCGGWHYGHDPVKMQGRPYNLEDK